MKSFDPDVERDTRLDALHESSICHGGRRGIWVFVIHPDVCMIFVLVAIQRMCKLSTFENMYLYVMCTVLNAMEVQIK